MFLHQEGAGWKYGICGCVHIRAKGLLIRSDQSCLYIDERSFVQIVDALLFKIVVDLGLVVADIAHIRCVAKDAADFVQDQLTFRAHPYDPAEKVH